eukprot:1802320-Pyramimonas_sp.AAC.1
MRAMERSGGRAARKTRRAVSKFKAIASEGTHWRDSAERRECTRQVTVARLQAQEEETGANEGVRVTSKATGRQASSPARCLGHAH